MTYVIICSNCGTKQDTEREQTTPDVKALSTAHTRVLLESVLEIFFGKVDYVTSDKITQLVRKHYFPLYQNKDRLSTTIAARMSELKKFGFLTVEIDHIDDNDRVVLEREGKFLKYREGPAITDIVKSYLLQLATDPSYYRVIT